MIFNGFVQTTYNSSIIWYYIILYYKKEININKYLLLRYLMGKQHGSLSRAGKVLIINWKVRK